MIAVALVVGLLAPPTLGDALRALGAFEPPPVVAPELRPAPPPPRTGAKVLIGSGAALFVAGLVGTIASPTCATHSADGACVDARGAHPVFPVLLVAGIAAAVTGSAWYREDAPPP